MSFDKLIESKIQDAIKAGSFNGLRGEGQPLRGIRPTDALAGENWLGFKILENGDMLPLWLTLGREIELDSHAVDRLEAQYLDWVGLAGATGDWERYAPALRRARKRFCTAARELRSKQDRFNIDAPSIRLERPQIWVEGRMERVDAKLRAARAPEWVLASV